MNKTLTLTIIFLLLTPIALADEVLTEAQYQDLKNTILQDGIKTRTELTLYTDRKSAEVMTSIETKVKPYIDENFEILDRRLHDLAQKWLVQLAIVMIASIILSNSIWFWIKKKIENKRKPLPKKIEKDTYAADKYGLASEEHLEKIKKENEEKKIAPIHREEEPEPLPPLVNTIKALLEQKRKKEAEEAEKKRLEEEEKLKKEYEKKQSEIKKLREKAEKKARKELKKIAELERDAPILPPRQP